MSTKSQGRTDRATRVIHASPAALYDAFSDPKKLVQWLPPNGMSGEALTYDFRVDGEYRIALRYLDTDATQRGKSSEHTDVTVI